LEGISFVTGGHQQVQTSKYFNSTAGNQHHITSITQLKQCLKQCDKFYAEIMFNLCNKIAQSSGYFQWFY